MGAIKNLNEDNLRLDIGASAEIIKFEKDKLEFSAGVDFFTFSNIRTETNFKFPVDAIDYLFGVNFNFRKKIGDDKLTARLRLSHISSHLQDGHIYEVTDTIFTPSVYSREFTDIELNYIRQLTTSLSLRTMGRLEFLFSTHPDNCGTFTPAFGVEMSFNTMQPILFYVSNEVSIRTVLDETNVNNNFELGLKLGYPQSRGLVIYFNYYDGQDYKGQYFMNMISYKAIGFKVDI